MLNGSPPACIPKLVNPEKVIPTTVEIVDIAGLVKGASKGEGLGNKFLANIRETDAIIHVLRCFEDADITHVANSIDPLRDSEIIETELMLADLESLDRQIQNFTQKPLIIIAKIFCVSHFSIAAVKHRNEEYKKCEFY